MTDNDPIPLKEAAAFFKIGVSTLMSARKRGLLTTTKPGREIRTSPNDVRRFLKKVSPKPFPPGVKLGELMFVPGGVYVVGFAGFVKIGWSTNLEKRIATIQQGVPDKLTIYGLFEGGIPEERFLHRRFREHRIRGEWFRNEGAVAEWVKRGCLA
jgi:hypothetical protein